MEDKDKTIEKLKQELKQIEAIKRKNQEKVTLSEQEWAKQVLDKNVISNMEEEILEAKRTLYFLLIKLDEDTITENELDIMFLLSSDKQIQSFLEQRK